MIRYCARAPFASENLRWNGPWLTYRLPKPCHTGKISIQLTPVEFIDKIAALIPPPRRHRHHYHGAFAPNSELRPAIAKAAIETPLMIVPTPVKATAQKTSFTWAKVLSRIYEVNPLLCVCGKEMRITKFVTHPTEIWRILTKLGWPTTAPDFDEPHDFAEWEICQLVLGTTDGFPADCDQSYTTGPDPPHVDDNIDPPHWENSYIQYD